MIDLGKVLDAVPDIIASQFYNNTNSSAPLNSTFSFTRSISNKSTFAFKSGYKLGGSVEVGGGIGIPVIAEAKGKLKIENSMSIDVEFGQETVTTQSYTHTSNVAVPPQKHLKVTAQVTRGNLEVPYKAKIRANDGAVQWAEGIWHGVSTCNLIVKQEDFTA